MKKMNYYSSKQTITTTGVFVGFLSGGYVFHLENEDMIDFDIIEPSILIEFDLKSGAYKNKSFEITYSEVMDDLDDEDIIIFKLESLTEI